MIRSFTNSDMGQVLDIWLEASIPAHDFIGKEFWKSRVGDMRDIYLPASETYVVDKEGTVRGFVSLYDDSMAALFVSPAFQGQGFGTLLVEKAKSLRSHLELTVYKGNKKGIAFYEKCGFKVVKEQIDRHTRHLEVVMSFSV